MLPRPPANRPVHVPEDGLKAVFFPLYFTAPVTRGLGSDEQRADCAVTEGGGGPLCGVK